MNISNATTGTQTATNVWATAIRRITGLGTSLGTAAGFINTPVANGTSVNFQPSAGSVTFANIVGSATTNVTWTFNLTNGSTPVTYSTAASGSPLNGFFVVNNSFFITIQNSGTVSGNYSSTQIGMIS
jgi:hypothetical protein